MSEAENPAGTALKVSPPEKAGLGVEGPNVGAGPTALFGLSLAVLLIWRFLAAQDAALNLSVDEAQYFLWSLEPAWGYFSKPPLIAWVIALATPVCGDSEACVRLPALLLFAASSIVVALLARRLYDTRTALWAGFGFATLVLTSFYSWFMTTDSILLFLWALALLFFHRALETDRWCDWLQTALVLGLGLLAKYSMGLFLACALAYLWLDHRSRLSTTKPWVAAVLALLFLVPNLLWNLDHQFATLRHTAEISQLDRQLLRPDSLFYFALGQFGVMGPLLLPALLLAFADRAAWRSEARQRFLVVFSLPVLALFTVLSLLSRANANWAAPVYVAATLLAVAMLVQRQRMRWLVAAIVLNLLIAAGIYHWHRIAPAIGIELKRGTNPFYPLHGWDNAGRQIAERLRETGCRALATGERSTLVELTYYARRALDEPVKPLAYNPGGHVGNHFALTADIANTPFDCAVLIGGDAGSLNEQFAEAQALAPVSVPKWGRMETHDAWLVRGFRHYRSR